MVATKNKQTSVKVEEWGNKKYFVVRDSKGRILSKSSQDKSKLSLDNAKEIYQTNKNLNINKKVVREKLTNVEIVSKTEVSSYDKRTEKPISNHPRHRAMYIVEGEFQGRKFVASSGMDEETAERKKEKAWEGFLEMIGLEFSGDYDANEGEKYIDKIKNIHEGWVYHLKVN